MPNRTIPYSRADPIRNRPNKTFLALPHRSSDYKSGRFAYGSLEEDYIRLLWITGFQRSSDSSRSIPVCEIRAVSIRYAESTRDYIALSYVWGANATSETIVCNSKRLAVTGSVFDALTHLYSQKIDQNLPIWIDSVCINQDDDVEKAIQVKRMHQIYRTAYKTIAFLGPAAEDSNYALEVIHDLTKRLARSPDLLHPKSLISNGLPHQYYRSWAALARVLDRPWFRRVWTFQEAVLGSRLRIVCGYVMIEWSVLHDFCYEMNRHILYYLLLSPYSKNDALHLFPNNVLLIENTRNTFRARGKCDFWRLWGIANARSVSKQIDRIYGMLDLASDSFRRRVPVDYGPSGDGDLRKALVNCAKTYIEEDPTLTLLSMVDDGTGNNDLPSWCPSLGKGHSIRRRLNWNLQAGYLLHTPRPSRVTTSNLTNTISVYGSGIDRVATVVYDTIHTLAANSHDSQKWAKHNESWLKECL